MNDIFILLGIEHWKPVVATLLLPPVPFLLLLLVGARLMLPRRGLGWFIVLLSITGLWFSHCTITARALSQFVLHPPAALSPERVAEIKAQVQAKKPVAIVVLGGGVRAYSPEYGVSNLTSTSVERLRYAVWLSRETGAPLAFSGGLSWAQAEAMPEAQVAARIAAQEFGRPLRWVEDQSRDTRENAGRSMTLLKPSSITEVLLVTHAWHMPRALRAFEQAAQGSMQIVAAPLGESGRGDYSVQAWLPSTQGYVAVHNMLHELLGLVSGS